ncbi:hypothetical protein RND81_14G132100 [Saponaria officinalis]|uniref:Transmembrane protein n=1 Tax=Saponaria officinalis TaxID=3572 RepID=A0AAW1GLX7_SAPOF
MGSHLQRRIRVFIRSLTVVIFILFISTNFQLGDAIRPLRGGQWLAADSNYSLIFEFLPKGQGSSSGSNPCSFIPGGKGHCK